MKRIYHPWWLWECYSAGFYRTTPPEDSSPEQAKEMYSIFLSNLNEFEIALIKIIDTWKYSCEHFLTNPSMNKIAWLGQASACIHLGLPSKFRSGYKLMSIRSQVDADNLAKEYYLKWKKRY